MKIKSIFLTVLFLISILFIKSCDTTETNNPANDPTADDPTASLPTTNDPTKSGIQFKLVDAPDDNYLQVWVDIIDFQYQRDDESGWVSFDRYPVESRSNMIDLTELIAGTSHVLADEEIDPGLFSKVRIVLGDNNYLTIEGEEEGEMIQKDLKTPSAQQSGLKIHVDTDLQAGYSYTFVLDWDVQKSIVKAGKSGNYNLKPVIRAHTEINAGDISGMVYEMDGDGEVTLEGVLVEVYDSNGDSVTTTETNETGAFVVQTLPIGTYNLKFSYSSEYVYDDEMIESVVVVKDETTDVGIIYMEKSTGSIKGRVADMLETEEGAEEMPLESATVEVYMKDNDNEMFIVETTSDEMGEFKVEELLPGTYIVKVMIASYIDVETEMFEVFIDTETDLGDIHLKKNVGSIEGRVAASADDSPLGGATVTVYLEGDLVNPIGDPVTTSAEDETKGNFNISDLPPGNYILKATLKDYNDGQSGVIQVIFDTTANTGTISLTASS